MERETLLFDAKGKVLGRLSTEIALALRGKNRVDYTPHIDAGAHIVVINAQHVKVTGTKETSKVYYRFSGYPGGLAQRTVKEQRERDARRIIESAVRGMLPKNKLAKGMITRLHVFNDDKHNFQITKEATA